MLLCDWCHESIDDKLVAKLMLCEDDKDSRYPDVILRGWPTFHQDCGIMALYAATEAIEDAAPDSRPDPADETLLRHHPYLGNENKPDGPLSWELGVRRVVKESTWHTLFHAGGIKTLLDASFRTRAEVAALPGIGKVTLAQLEAAMGARGLKFSEQRDREAVA